MPELETTLRRSTRSNAAKVATPIRKANPNEPLKCLVCPRVYHFKCSGAKIRPATRAWYCPWHACATCLRKSSAAGGTLFHCVSCPLAYCFDCAPDEHTEGGQSTSAAALSLKASLERKGMSSLRSYMFFTCADCKIRNESEKKAKRKARTKIEVLKKAIADRENCKKGRTVANVVISIDC
mmetsp:Transcript_39279/g.47858  ORF Transcript_39279/g.47858 Transcript_39279/m.47858 type:complete len:181 (+) Transcript_39279:818-1360(+)